MPPASDPKFRLLVRHSAAPKDVALAEELLGHLRLLERFAGVDVWSEARIRAGDETRREISRAIQAADVALLLLSSDFFASDGLVEVEVPRLLERHRAGQLRVIPVLLRSCLWEVHPWLKELDPLPKGRKALGSFSGEDRDAVLTELAREIVGLATSASASQAHEAASSQTAAGSSAGADAPIDFAILTAIEVERRAVCAAFGLEDDHRVKKGARVYWRGRLLLKRGEFYELVVAQYPEMANVDAALLTSDLLHHWSPGAALMVGIAASTKPEEVKLGDVVAGSDVYYYERGKVTPKGTKPEPKMVPVDAALWANVTALPEWKPKLSVPRRDGTKAHPKLHLGVIASGEKVLADEAVRDQIAAGHRKILALEMEGYGFSKAVWQNFDRVRHLVIRGICDDGSPAKDDRWHAYAAASAAGLAKHFLLDRPLEPRNTTAPPGPRQA